MEEKNFMSWYRPDGVAIDFAVYEKKPGYSSSVPLHCHDYFEIEFVISGVMKNTVNGSKQRMERGDLFILSVADSHKIDIESGNCLIYKLNFRPDAFPPDMRGLLASTPLPLVQHYNGSEFDAMLSDFERFSRADADSDNGTLSNVALRVAAERSAGFRRPRPSRVFPRRCARESDTSARISPSRSASLTSPRRSVSRPIISAIFSGSTRRSRREPSFASAGCSRRMSCSQAPSSRSPRLPRGSATSRRRSSTGT